MTRYAVLSSSSLGYRLLSLDGQEIRQSQKRGKVSYREKSIVTGDIVELDKDGFIATVVERKTYLPRPRLANADEIAILCSLTKPDFSTYLLNKFLSMVNFCGIHAAILVNKCDLATKKQLDQARKDLSYYENLGYPVFFLSSLDAESFDFARLVEHLKTRKVAFMGQTGVGKSTLLNRLDPTLRRKVDSLYPEVNRGRHTTKETVLIPYHEGFLYDTPGFSDFQLVDMKEGELATFFPGFESLFHGCLFKDCLHLPSSKGCAILKAVEEKRIPSWCYDDYCKINEEVKENSRWKKRK